MTKSHYRDIIRLGLPILIGQLGMIVTGMVDTKMVGTYSTEALASASFVNNLFNIAIFACLGFTYGLTPIVGSLFTRGLQARIGESVRAGVVVNVIFSLLVTGIMGIIYLNLDKLGQPAELMPLIRPYYLIYLAGLLPVSLFNVFAQWSYGINHTRLPMWIILAANAVNILGNYILIYGNFGFPELGLTGAGIATFIARLLCPVAIIAIFTLKRQWRPYRDGYTARPATMAGLRRIASMSWPVALQMTLESGSFTAAAVMAGWLGTISLAAFQIVIIVGTLGFCVYYSIGSAVSVLVAGQLGRGDAEAMRRVAFDGFRLLLAVATVSSLFFIFCGPWLMQRFTDDPDVIALALTLIVPLVLYQYGDATQINFANALRGTTVVMPMLWIAFVSYIVVGLPATYLLGFTAGLGVRGIIFSFSVSLFLAAALFLIYFIRNSRPRS